MIKLSMIVNKYKMTKLDTNPQISKKIEVFSISPHLTKKTFTLAHSEAIGNQPEKQRKCFPFNFPHEVGAFRWMLIVIMVLSCT